ncbi:MAG: hypothetical protein ACREQQ_17770, partial [Candidatus Binatia bacterium]
MAACSGGGSSGGEGGAPPDSEGEGSLLLPLIGEPPGGVTSEVVEPALEAALEGLGYDFESGSFVSVPVAPSELLLRPGVQIFPESILPGWCTAAFVFDGAKRIATAGHCTNVGDAVLALAAPSTVFVVGFTSQSTGPDSAIGDDWALIDILPFWRPFTDPAVALVGGPCGRASDPEVPVIKFVGHAAGIGTGGTPRTGAYLGKEEGAFLAVGPSLIGDSGAPVLEATQADPGRLCVGGGAVGILTHGEI